VIGHAPGRAETFAPSFGNDRVRPAGAVDPAADVVITATTSATPVYDQPAATGRLVIGVGAYRHDLAEIGARTLAGSQLFVDDPEGARHEARSEEHTSELQSRENLVCRLLLEKKKMT